MNGDEDVWKRVRARWAHRGDLEFIRKQLRRRGADPDRLTPADLAAFDQLHSGHQQATETFARWVGVPKGIRVIDVGAGLGGSARFLAQAFDCRVTALELAPELVDCGTELTRWLGLERLVHHRCAELTSWNDTELYDLIWLQHVDMHIPNKIEAYRRCAEALDTGSADPRIVWHDWLAGPGGPTRFPLPWSGEDDEITFVSTRDELEENLSGAGLELLRFKEIAEMTIQWFTTSRDKIAHALQHPNVKGRQRLEKLILEAEGVIGNVQEKRLVPFFGEARARSVSP